MSSSSIITFLFLLSLSCFGQTHSISGRVTDNTGQPIPFADVAVTQQLADSTFFKVTQANDAGQYQITTIPRGNNLLKISAIGFADKALPVSVDDDLTMPDVILQEEVKELGEIVVTSKRPIVTRKIDRLEFNVENSTLSSENAWEILKKTPGVSSASDQLTIRGSAGILITINDKKVYLTGTELKNLLENTDGENIKSIEVITTPPAKYEAQGSAVLNIKMKRGGMLGYKGSVSGAYVQGVYPKGVLSTNHYYTNKKLSVSGGLMFGSGTYYSSSDNEVKYFSENGAVSSTWKGKEEATFKAESQKTYNLDIEYRIDSLNTLNLGGNGFNNLKSTANFVTPIYIYGADGVLDSLFVTNNHRDYPQKNSTYNGTFEHRFNEKDKISISGDYTNHYFNENQDILSDFSLPNALPYRSSRILSDDTRNIYLLSLQADYNANKWDSNIEAGVRYGTVEAENNYTYADEGGIPDSGRSNQFLYDEKILAGYIGADRELGKWSFKAGLRGEYTELEGNSVTAGQVNRQEYFKLFPTAYTLYKPDSLNQIGLSYGKRIIRPQYGALNPFRSYSSPYSYTAGNPALQPALGHNLSLTYTFKNKYNFDLYYRYEKDPTMEVSYQDYATSTRVNQITNINSSGSYGLDFYTNLELWPWWESGLQTNLGYTENIFQGVDGMLYTNDIFSYGINSNNRFNLAKDRNLLAEANFIYRSPFAQGAFEFGSMSGLSLSIRKKFLDGNGEITAIFSDVYKGEIMDITTSYGNQYSSSSVYGESQTFRLQFRYRFGNQKLGDGKSRQSTEEQQRL